ncbi:MAG: histidinol dehydrogenase [Nitrospinae bacterium]|nr:histidinol dehydrogenase [Nitrospinota bacterium]
MSWLSIVSARKREADGVRFFSTAARIPLSQWGWRVSHNRTYTRTRWFRRTVMSDGPGTQLRARRRGQAGGVTAMARHAKVKRRVALLEYALTELHRQNRDLVQAIGAMAYGTQHIPKTDKIVGPGNMYVAAAKRVVYGTVDIDMIAGPSELLVIADDTANPVHCAADLLCEAEHDEEARVYLVTPSASVAKAVVKEVAKQLARLSRKQIATHSVGQYAIAFVTSTMEQAFDVANAIAAEHLELLVTRPFQALKKVRHAGAVFVGAYTPPAVADYVAGPNHVLPTGGSARFFSALSLDDYVKKTNIVAYNKKQLKAVQPYVTCLAGMEGFQAHARSIESRNL